MNCLACSLPYKFYPNSTNCLNCPKYANYLQTECINTIPDGYYLLDKENGFIEQCYYLCKTCKSAPYMVGEEIEIHMNCETCLYQNSSKITIEGNCPLSNENNDNNKNQNKDKNSKSKSNSLAIWISIFAVIFVLIIIGIIVYVKCFKNKEITKRDNSDYYNIGKKNIPFDEEDNSGIN